MRRGGVLLLLIAFVVAAIAAKGNADGLPSEMENNSTTAHSSVRKVARLDSTSVNEGKVIDEPGGARKKPSKNQEKDEPRKGPLDGRDEPIKEPMAKENTGNASSAGQSVSTNESSQEMDFLRDPRVKECDPSHRCIIEDKKFIACLRVPGEDSLALSLLIDNGGTSPLDIAIMAPDFVNLEEAKVQLKANDHKEVSVSIGDGANDTAIVLKVGKGNCSLNLHNMITKGTPRVSSYMRMRLASVFMLVAALVFLGAVGLCIKFCRTRHQESGPTYQKLDMELPVSTGGKKESQSDQWDSSWGDDWDDEEAPLTPLKSISNPSVKGLASRRSTKDGWKN